MEAIGIYRQRGDGLAVARATLDALHVYTTPDRVDRLVHDALDALAGAGPHLEALLLVELASQTLGRDLRTDLERQRLDTLVATHHWDDVTAAILLSDTAYASDLGIHDAASRFRDAFERFDQLGQPGQAALALNTWAFTTTNTGELDAGLAAYDEFGNYARRHGIRYLEDSTLSYVTFIHLARGDWATIDRLQGVHRERLPDSAGSQRIDAFRHFWAGRLDDAIAAFPPPDPVIPGIQVGDLAWLTGILLAAGRTAEAAGSFAQLRTLLDEAGTGILYGTAISIGGGCVVELGDEPLIADLDEFLAHYDAMADPQVVWAGVPTPRPFADYDLARGRVDEAERRYQEALVWTQRERCPVEEGLCHLGLADIAEQRGDHLGALDHLDTAGALFAQHGHKFFLDQVLAKKEILKA
jgi:tetratricopeptide (TPR) repeat protein